MKIAFPIQDMRFFRISVAITYFISLRSNFAFAADPCKFVGPVCDYDFVIDNINGISAEETYFAICEQRGNRYQQSCYPESLLGDSGPGDLLENRAEVLSCGCCPEDGTRIRGSTPVCDGALDCFGEGIEPKEIISKQKSQVKFNTCIDGEDTLLENFFEPLNSEEASCGKCFGCDIDLNINTGNSELKLIWVMSNGTTNYFSDGPVATYAANGVFQERTEIFEDCSDACFTLDLAIGLPYEGTGETFSVSFNGGENIILFETSSDLFYVSFGPGCPP